jgi:peptidylprolyl isomerase
MKRTILRTIAVIVILIAGFIGYQILNQPEQKDLPPIPPAAAPADTESSAAPASDDSQTAASDDATDETPAADDSAAATDDDGDEPAVAPTAEEILVIDVAGQTTGTIEIQLARDLAPNHVNRIIAIAEAGGYDGVVFHRVIDGFMAQTGDVLYGKKDGDAIMRAGMGGSDLPNLKAEFSNAHYARGVVGMARGQGNDTANSQFFIMFDDADYLDGKYTVVGRVISGMDVVDQIKRGEASSGAVPMPADYMSRVRLKPQD